MSNQGTSKPKLVDLCHMCGGSGIDDDADAAAAYPRHCVNCRGSGEEPERDYEEDGEASHDPT